MIRSALAEDVTRLAEIHTFGWRWAYRGIVPDRELFVERTVEKSAIRWRQILERPGDVLVLDDGVVKGFVIHGPTRDHDIAGAWEVMAIYVEPAFIREGCGSALIRASEEVGKDFGHRLSTLWVLEANSRARAFYEKSGYRPDGALKVVEGWNNAVELRYVRTLD